MSLAAAGAAHSIPSDRSRPRRPPSDALRTTRRWTVSVLALATTGLLGYVALLLALSRVLVSAWTAATGRAAVPLDLLAVGTDLAPVLLVGWCTGMAASAGLSGGRALGPRVAGLAAGALGALAGLAVLALTDLP